MKIMENKHCSYCKYYYCYNASMYCSHPTKYHKITAKRKNGCKYFEKIQFTQLPNNLKNEVELYKKNNEPLYQKLTELINN